MKYVLYLVLCLISTITYCQDSYLFNKVLEYEVKKPLESVHKGIETRFYFINTQDNSYVAVAVLKKNGTYNLVFRDDKKNKIAEIIVRKQDLFDVQRLTIRKKFLKRNLYSNPITIDDYTIGLTVVDSVTEVYKYTYKRSKWSNRYKIKSHVIVVNKNGGYFMPGVGFGDYYSLLDWKEKFPIGQIQESLTEKLDGTIVSHYVLSKASRCNITFDLR